MLRVRGSFPWQKKRRDVALIGHHIMRSRHHLKLLVLPLALCALVIVSCGTHGAPPALGKPVTLTLSPTGDVQLSGTIAFAPLAAMRIAVYYHGALLPVTNAKTPAQLRIGGCYNAVTAPLTDGNPPSVPLTSATPITTPSPSATAATPPLHLDPAGGVDVPIASGADRFVTITARPDDPSAPVVDCGQPLSGNEQYFDLYPPETGSNSIATGSALVVPLSATRITFALKDGNSQLHPTTWAILTGGCTGKLVESGTIGADGAATQIVYAALNTTTWQVVITHSNSATTCYSVK